MLTTTVPTAINEDRQSLRRDILISRTLDQQHGPIISSAERAINLEPGTSGKKPPKDTRLTAMPIPVHPDPTTLTGRPRDR